MTSACAPLLVGCYVRLAEQTHAVSPCRGGSASAFASLALCKARPPCAIARRTWFSECTPCPDTAALRATAHQSSRTTSLKVLTHPHTGARAPKRKSGHGGRGGQHRERNPCHLDDPKRVRDQARQVNAIGTDGCRTRSPGSHAGRGQVAVAFPRTLCVEAATDPRRRSIPVKHVEDVRARSREHLSNAEGLVSAVHRAWGRINGTSRHKRGHLVLDVRRPRLDVRHLRVAGQHLRAA